MKTSVLSSLPARRAEILAPAGNAACALAAFDAGADAVYCGLKRFNARERTGNFTEEELGGIIAYAHKNDRRVYVTFNTLVKEGELDEAAKSIADLELLHPDAVIVQDLGIVRLIRDYFPALAIHASTQMGLHNSAGLAFAAQLGAKRVILERQTTLDEIEAMMRSNPPVELEMFIHGALCCCISGSCLLSSWLGGWSGNRGKCKQPCRRRYHTDAGNGFFLSSQDLCTLELLPRILRTGVASLKIEGRLRRSDYVENVVSAYRLAVDAAAAGEDAFRDALPKAKELLAKTCGRKWSEGFYTEESRRTLMKFDSLGASGQLCGKVVSNAKNGFSVSASRRIHLGDAIRVQPRSGDEGPAITVTKMTVNGHPAARALKGEICFIHSDKPVEQDALVYKTGESTADYTKRLAALPPFKCSTGLQIELDRSKIRVSVPALGQVWEKAMTLDEAGNHPVPPETVSAEFSSVQGVDYAAGMVETTVNGRPFLPASVLKSLRKEFAVWLDALNPADAVRAANGTRLDAFRREHTQLRAPAAPGQRPDAAIVPRRKRLALPAGTEIIREIADAPSPHESLLLPFFIRERDLKSVRAALADFIAHGGKKIRISSVHHLALLAETGAELEIGTCMPLPVCNSFAAAELKARGVLLAQGWLELGKDELEALALKSPLPLELYRGGRPPLLSTHAKITADGMLSDARGNVFRLTCERGITTLTAEKVMSVPAVRGFVDSLWDFRRADPAELRPGSEVSRFNFDCGLS